MAGRRRAKADRKTITIPIRATADERDRMRKVAKAEGLGLSSWLRRLGLKAVAESGE